MTDRPFADGVVWTDSNEEPGSFGIPAFLAGTPVALLAGFDLATAILVLAQRPSPDPWRSWAGWSCTAFCLGIVFLLCSLALAGKAQFISIAPDQALAWFPETALGAAELEATRKLVWHARRRVGRRVNQAIACWVLGLCATAVAFDLAVVSYDAGTSRYATIAVLSLGTLIVSAFFLTNESLKGAKNEPVAAISERARALFVRQPPRAHGISSTRARLRHIAELGGIGVVYAQCEAFVSQYFDSVESVGPRLVASSVNDLGAAEVLSLCPLATRPTALDKGRELMTGWNIAGIEASSGLSGDVVRDRLVHDWHAELSEHETTAFVFVASDVDLETILDSLGINT